MFDRKSCSNRKVPTEFSQRCLLIFCSRLVPHTTGNKSYRVDIHIVLTFILGSTIIKLIILPILAYAWVVVLRANHL